MPVPSEYLDPNGDLSTFVNTLSGDWHCFGPSGFDDINDAVREPSAPDSNYIYADNHSGNPTIASFTLTNPTTITATDTTEVWLYLWYNNTDQPDTQVQVKIRVNGSEPGSGWNTILDLGTVAGPIDGWYSVTINQTFNGLNDLDLSIQVVHPENMYFDVSSVNLRVYAAYIKISGIVYELLDTITFSDGIVGTIKTESLNDTLNFVDVGRLVEYKLITDDTIAFMDIGALSINPFIVIDKDADGIVSIIFNDSVDIKFDTYTTFDNLVFFDSAGRMWPFSIQDVLVITTALSKPGNIFDTADFLNFSDDIDTSYSKKISDFLGIGDDACICLDATYHLSNSIAFIDYKTILRNGLPVGGTGTGGNTGFDIHVTFKKSLVDILFIQDHIPATDGPGCCAHINMEQGGLEPFLFADNVGIVVDSGQGVNDDNFFEDDVIILRAGIDGIYRLPGPGEEP